MATQGVADTEPRRRASIPARDEDPVAHAVGATFQIGFVVRIGLIMACGAALSGAAVYAVLAKDLGSYAQNVLASAAFELHRELNRIGKAVDRDRWEMSPPTVNAYYHPLKNQMVFRPGSSNRRSTAARRPFR